VARSFCRQMIQPIKDRVHPAYEYCGQSDPTREVNCKVSKEEMVARVSQIYSGRVKMKKCPPTWIRRQGGRKVLLPRGGESWCRRSQRMPSDVDWRRSVVLQRCRRRCLQLLSLGCFGRRLGFRP
jgi:hypothetical protein